MNRRQLLKLLALGVGGLQLDVDLPLYVPVKTIFIPHPKQVEFFESNLPPALWGIPYHQTNASSGQWLGFSRAFELINLNDKEPKE